MEMLRMVTAVAVIISLLVLLSTDLASNGGSLSPSMAPEAFFAKDSSYYDSKLQARDSCGDPGTAHAASYSNSGTISNNSHQTEGFVCSFLMMKGIKEDRLNPYNNQTEYCKAPSKTHDMVYPKTSPLVHDVCVDSILDIAEGYEESQTENFAVDIYVDLGFCPNIKDNATGPSTTKQVTGYIDLSNNFLTGSLPSWILDGFAGDVTITANRTGYVDFTMPYTQSAADDDSKPSIQWTFFKPLPEELWLATVCFVFFTAFVFWMIERSINPVFQGSSLAQCSNALYFVFSTLTFSHGQILRSPLSKIVLVVWCLAVLVLVESYVANLSSMLAAEASATNGSSSGVGTAPLTLRSLSGLFVVSGCILALMLLISLTRSAYAAYTSRVRGSESQSTPQNDEENGPVVVPELPVHEDRDNDAQGAHVSGAISGDEEAGGVIQDSMSNASEPASAPDVNVQIEMTSVQIEMTSTSSGVGGAL